MVARDHHKGRVRQSGPQALELLEEEEDRGIRRPDGVKDIARQHDQVRALSDQIIYRAPERIGDIRLALVATPGGLPLVLAESEVQVGEVGEFHPLTSP